MNGSLLREIWVQPAVARPLTARTAAVSAIVMRRMIMIPYPAPPVLIVVRTLSSPEPLNTTRPPCS